MVTLRQLKQESLRSALRDLEEALMLVAAAPRSELMDKLDILLNRTVYEIDRTYYDDFDPELEDELSSVQSSFDFTEPSLEREELDFNNLLLKDEDNEFEDDQ